MYVYILVHNLLSKSFYSKRVQTNSDDDDMELVQGLKRNLRFHLGQDSVL
jgi:hypothetical protein